MKFTALELLDLIGVVVARLDSLSLDDASLSSERLRLAELHLKLERMLLECGN